MKKKELNALFSFTDNYYQKSRLTTNNVSRGKRRSIHISRKIKKQFTVHENTLYHPLVTDYLHGIF